MASKSKKPKKKSASPAKKRGRPSDFTDEYKRQLVEMAKLGMTDAQMAVVIGKTEQTINNWKAAHPDFFESIKEAKAIADREVEASLFKRATGMTVKDMKFATYEGEITDSKTYEKELAPDTTACIFWLKNRMPEKYRDTQHHEVGGSLGKLLDSIRDNDGD